METNEKLNSNKYRENEEAEEKESEEVHYFGSKSQTNNLKSSNFPVFRSLQPVSRILKSFSSLMPVYLFKC